MDKDLTQYTPPRRRGLIIHIGLVLILLGVGAVFFLLATQQQAGIEFMLYLLIALALLVPVPLLAYRAYALLRAGYDLHRDGLRIRWGLRAEDIPLPKVEWVRSVHDLGYSLPLPPLAMPGAILGSRNSAELGPVEFMASDLDTMLLVATSEKVYAISPAMPEQFTRAFQRSMELGSITPMPALSVKPAAFLSGVWQARFTRWLILAGVVLNLVLFILVSVSIAGRQSISLGFDLHGRPVEPGASARLLLLPVLSVIIFLADLIAGLFFYRHEGQRPAAFMLWLSGSITTVMLIVAVFVILSIS